VASKATRAQQQTSISGLTCGILKVFRYVACSFSLQNR